jgi:hypothetical protein
MSFDSWNHTLKIQESIGTLIPKVGAHLGICGLIPSHSTTFPWAWNVTPRLHFQLALLQVEALVVSLRLSLWQELHYNIMNMRN